jgi:hypothetical protein
LPSCSHFLKKKRLIRYFIIEFFSALSCCKVPKVLNRSM